MARERTVRSLTRREFNAASVNALFVGMTVWMSGCSGGGGSSPAAPTAAPTPTSAPAPAGTGDKGGTIAANHGHVATVTGAQLLASGAVTLDIRGTADHDQAVQLSVDQVRQIAAGTRVTQTSTQSAATPDGYGGSTPGHTHSVTFN
jgi:hypothetical protein